MKTEANVVTGHTNWKERNRVNGNSLMKWGVAIAMAVAMVGCQTQKAQNDDLTASSQVIYLREGDVLKISFPGSPSLDTSQQIRRDGKITLPLVGDVQASGMTAETLQRNLVKLFAPQLSSKEVLVTVASSSFPVFVTGAVIRPGKITSDHPITALDAIMEAGGFDYTKANLKAVRVLRHSGDQVHSYTLNLKQVLDGKEVKQFYLQPSDIVFVPERLNLF